MWRCAAVLALIALAGCSAMDSLTPSAAPTSVPSGQVAVSNPRFGDSDPHEWQGKTPWTYAVHGTDVSKYQTSIDWSTAKASGISFAFIKATEGADRIDDYFAEHWRMTRAAGIPRSAYHFFYFCRSAAEQARWFIQNVPKERGALPPVLDMEWNDASPSCKLRPDPETVRKEMKIFLDIVEKHYGKKPIIYTSIDFFDDNELSKFRGYPYWLRSVAGHPTEKYGDHPFTFWQYTGTGVIPGIRGNADINVFNGDMAAWKKWLKANAS
ncbi:MAG: glycoside hydrolase family 25 protein [Mesorhizobium sp.]|nr:GH25 family lysozyme [Mesorhizobium sp.]MBL8575836.1 glycoside hydrolase family 25 protein [Mesorhizobium sp.]